MPLAPTDAHTSPDSLPDLEIVNLSEALHFSERSPRKRSVRQERDALLRLAHILASNPAHILQDLVDTAVDLCQADSAGISLAEITPEGEQVFRWVATAGKFAPFLNQVVPRSLSPCSTCLDRDCPQIFSGGAPFRDPNSAGSLPVAEGLLIPWHFQGVDGTIWVVSHDDAHLFDPDDVRLLQTFSELAGVALGAQRTQRLLRQQESLAASASLANDLAHQINNPLQSITNALFLAARFNSDPHLQQALEEVNRLNRIVAQLLQQNARQPQNP